jgi:hypothetical protein
MYGYVDTFLGILHGMKRPRLKVCRLIKFPNCQYRLCLSDMRYSLLSVKHRLITSLYNLPSHKMRRTGTIQNVIPSDFR